MKYLAVAVLFIPVPAFAACGFADAYYDHRQWIFPAYFHCLVFGLIFLSGMYIMSLIYKTKTQEITKTISSYLLRHRMFAIMVTGILLAIPLGLIGSVSWEIIWFLCIYPALATMVAYPLGLVNRRFREKWMLSPFAIKWAFMISISAVSASLIFIILTNCGLLSAADVTYLARPIRSHLEYHNLTHPYDSMKEIWQMPLILIAEIPLALILYWFGLLNKCLYRNLSQLRLRKQKIYRI